MPRTLIAGGTIITPEDILPDQTLVIEGSRITDLAPGKLPPNSTDVYIDADGLWVAPGLIDLHIHGCAGADTMDGNAAALRRMGRFLASHGVTSYLPTTRASSPQATMEVIRSFSERRQPQDGAHHLGLHLEGPYLNPDFAGAQPHEHLRAPDPDEYRVWLSCEGIRLITVAPELEGTLALLDAGVARGIQFAIGHSGATYEQVLEAVDHGLRQASHTFNAMSGFHHRRPGVLGAVLTDDRIYAQVIADGIHLHPSTFNLLLRCKTAARVILISDSIRAAGMRNGEHEFGGKEIQAKRGVLRTTSGALAGTTLTLDKALRNALQFSDLDLSDVLPMATSVPAEALGLRGRKGVLAPGADADVILLSPNLTLMLTLVAGREVHRSDRYQT